MSILKISQAPSAGTSGRGILYSPHVAGTNRAWHPHPLKSNSSDLSDPIFPLLRKSAENNG